MKNYQIGVCDSETSTYEIAYVGAQQLMAPCCLAELQEALVRLAPVAREEAAWGVIDALSDLVADLVSP
jgi:hypothetical protein